MSIDYSNRTEETSGMLMSIIQTISIGGGSIQKEKQKSKLEKAHKDCDKHLNQLVSENQQDLSSIIQAFGDISSKISTSQERIRAIKDNLQSCKNLLHCKRDELRKLWIEGIEHKTVVQMLDQIEKVKDVTDKIQVHIERKHYLHATKLVVQSVNILDKDLVRVDALRDVKNELNIKHEELHDLLVEELHKLIYIKSTSGVVRGFQRFGSLRASQRDKSVPAAAPSLSDEQISDPKMLIMSQTSLEQISIPKQIIEDLTGDPEENPVNYIALLIECLAMLGKLPEAIDNIRGRCKPGLLAIVQRSTQQVADNAYFEDENLETCQQPLYLLELLELILEQFKVVAHTHQIVLANLQRVKSSVTTFGDFGIYDMLDIWTRMQEVLQLLLSDYLDIRNSSYSQNKNMDFDQPTADINQYFSRKKSGRPKKLTLFRFDASSHAISMDSYLREQRQEYYGTGQLVEESGRMPNKAQLVCKPSADNIKVIYSPIFKFIKDINQTMRLAVGAGVLENFITHFIKNSFLPQVMNKIKNNNDSATKAFDSLKIVIDAKAQKELDVSKPLLQSTVTVARNLQHLQDLMRHLPDYADQFMKMFCSILADHRTMAQQSLRETVCFDSDDKRIISATWARDSDINRFLRSLPNWTALKADKTASLENSVSEADMRALNAKESSILTSNLSSFETLQPRVDILVDYAQLRSLGNLSESLEWFSRKTGDFHCSLSQKKTCMSLTSGEVLSPRIDMLQIPKDMLSTVNSLREDFDNLSEQCIMILHLEVRLHCFFYLMPLTRQTNYSCAIDDLDPDSNVKKLNKDLSSLEEAMSQSLHLSKFRYVFDGLGHLCSSILISCAHFLKKVNENGIKKMCRNIFSIQQNLTSITLNRELDLDLARQYYELLYLSPQDILNTIIERGAYFKENEYESLLGLAHRSTRGSSDQLLQASVDKLKQILADTSSIVQGESSA